MKKILIYGLLILTFWSCSVSDDAPNYHFEFVPIESVDMPLNFTLGQIYDIEYTYNKPTTCHIYHDLYYTSNNNERTIAVVNAVYDDAVCDTLIDNQIQRSFPFKVRSNGSYVFKFWQGEDDNGEDIYLTYEVEVID